MTYPPNPGEQPPPYGHQPPPYGHQPPPYGQPPSYEQPSAPGQLPPPYGQQPPPQPFGAPPAGFGGFPPAPPARKSRALPIVLLSLGIVAVLCIGGFTALYLVGKKTVDDLAAVTITEPATIGNRPKLESQEFAAITADMEKSLSAYPGAQSSFGAIYGDPNQQDMVAALATKAVIADPQKELDASFATFGKEAPVSGLTKADTGTLGGVAQCGTSSVAGVDVAVCGWADEGSVGMVMWFFKTAPDVQAEFPQVRAAIETKTTKD